MSEPKNLQVLLVDDSEDDVLLITRTLMRGGYTLDYQRVDTLDQMLHALQKQAWDIVTVDYAMPKFDGLEAVQTIRTSGYDMPVIIVSGTIGEEVAVAAVKAGVNDYIMKDNLSRLVPTVQRELQEVSLRRAQAATEDQLRKINRAVEHSPVAVIITRRDGTIEYVNPRFCQMSGYSAEQAIGETPSFLQSDKSSREDYEVLWQTISQGEEWSSELANKHKDGSLYWVSASISPVFNNAGEITHYIALEEDITDRKRNEEERINLVERMQRQHTTLVDLMTQPAINTGQLTTAFHNIIQAVQKTLQVERVVINAFSDNERLLYPLWDPAQFSGKVQKQDIGSFPHYLAALNAGQVIAAANVFVDTRTEELSDYWRDNNVTAVIEAAIRIHGHVIGVLSHQVCDGMRAWYPDEITFATQAADLIAQALLNANLIRRRREAETLRAVTQVLSSTLNLQQVFELILSELQKVVPYDSASVQRLDGDHLVIIGGHGFPNLDELLGLKFDLDSGGNPNIQVINTRKPIVLEDASARFSDFLREPHAAAEISSWIGVPLIVGDRVIGMIALDKREPAFYTQEHARLAQAFASQAAIALENASIYAEEERRAAELAKALDKQKELDELKDQFIQNVSHELRTPMAIARGYAELLEMGELGELKPEQQQPVHIVARRLRMLTRLVDNINAILEAQTEENEPEPVDMQQLVASAVSGFQVTLAPKSITMHSNIATNISMIMGDQIQLGRVLDNLLTNAMKFTPEGGTITVNLRQDDNVVVIEVVDTGIGIPEDQLDRIFERFYQVDGGISRRYGGTGLGLALVKEIVTRHNGTVSVKSTVGKGSTFTVCLPT